MPRVSDIYASIIEFLGLGYTCINTFLEKKSKCQKQLWNRHFANGFWVPWPLRIQPNIANLINITKNPKTNQDWSELGNYIALAIYIYTISLCFCYFVLFLTFGMREHGQLRKNMEGGGLSVIRLSFHGLGQQLSRGIHPSAGISPQEGTIARQYNCRIRYQQGIITNIYCYKCNIHDAFIWIGTPKPNLQCFRFVAGVFV